MRLCGMKYLQQKYFAGSKKKEKLPSTTGIPLVKTSKYEGFKTLFHNQYWLSSGLVNTIVIIITTNTMWNFSDFCV